MAFVEAEVLYPQSQAQAQATTSQAALLQPKLSMAFLTNPPSVNFAAADFTASAGPDAPDPHHGQDLRQLPAAGIDAQPERPAAGRFAGAHHPRPVHAQRRRWALPP